MTKTWILLAHGSEARLLEVSGNGEKISLIKEFFHSRTAKKNKNPNEKEPVHPSRDYSGDMEDYERQVFAKELAIFLEKAHDENQYNRLILAISRNLLGDLRKTLTTSVLKIITHELNKDLLSQRFTDAELVKKIKEDCQLLSF